MKGWSKGIKPKIGLAARTEEYTGVWAKRTTSCVMSNAETEAPTTTTLYKLKLANRTVDEGKSITCFFKVTHLVAIILWLSIMLAVNNCSGKFAF